MSPQPGHCKVTLSANHLAKVWTKQTQNHIKT